MLLTIIYVRYQYVLLPQVHLAWQAFLVFHGKGKENAFFLASFQGFEVVFITNAFTIDEIFALSGF